MRIEVVDGEAAFARAAADVVCDVVAAREHATVALPSGKTPLGLYEELARRVAAFEADLSDISIFAVDELHGVPRDHPATNASYLRAQLSNRIALRALHVLDSEAADAGAECARFLQLIVEAGGFDLAVLGIGTNGHIAFNEPGSPFDSGARKVELEPSTREPYVGQFGSYEATPACGLTLGIADLLAARRVLLLASGGAKAGPVASALRGPQTEALPASAIQRHPDLVVILDSEAASELRGSATS